MPVRETIVRSLGEFVDVVTPREPDPQTRRRRDTGVYRSASEASRPLLTSLDRLGGCDPPHTKVDLEEHILRNFIRYSRPHLDDARPHNDWELLIAAQHHGVPTRLLDWSYSPLVAAFFATRPLARQDERDRAVWRLDWQSLHRRFNIPPLALLIQDLDTLLGAQSLTPWKLFAARSGRAFACMIEPPSLDNRIPESGGDFHAQLDDLPIIRRIPRVPGAERRAHALRDPGPGRASLSRSTRPRRHRRAPALPRPGRCRERDSAVLRVIAA